MGALARVRAAGVNAASVVDLITVGFARREADVELGEDAARKMLQRFGSLKALCQAGFTDLEPLTGFDSFEHLRAMALTEIGRRCANTDVGDRQTIDVPEDALPFLEYLRDEKREHFVAILLDAKNHVMRVAEIHVGTLTSSMVGPREVFREAIRDGASSVLVAHNHPSGDPTPSPDDMEVTKRLCDVGAMLDIPVVDHIIVGQYCTSIRRGREFGRPLGRPRTGVARESAGYARGEGIGAWTLQDLGTTCREVDTPYPSETVRRGNPAPRGSQSRR